MPPKGVCRCEARIAAVVLAGYSCGNPGCWRTAVAKASFDAFVVKLVTARGDEPEQGDGARHPDT